MTFRLLIANRGEVAVRIIGAARDLGMETVAVYARDDLSSQHLVRADVARPIGNAGNKAYLDIARLVEIAKDTRCDAVHPGYGYLSESAEFASACAEAGLIFVGPAPGVLSLFGDKAAARGFASRLGIPVPTGTPGAASLDDAVALMKELPVGSAVIIKAVHGGGGRGIAVATSSAELPDAYRRAQAEAASTWNDPSVLVERYLDAARHIEVQVIGDVTGRVVVLGDRDCSIQRRYQKLVEVAPAQNLGTSLRRSLHEAALLLATESGLRGAGTFEFLVSQDEWHFLEANPRLQVEHTVTEEVTGVDIVQAQLRLARGDDISQTLADSSVRTARVAIQLRVNAEEYDQNRNPVLGVGKLSQFRVPTGRGIRVDTAATEGYAVSAAYDALLAKVVVNDSTMPAACSRGRRALDEFAIAGVPTNIALLRQIIMRPEVLKGEASTGFLEAHLGELLGEELNAPLPASEDDMVLRAPSPGVVVELAAASGDVVRAGEVLVVIEAMKMRFEVRARRGGRVLWAVTIGQDVRSGDTLLQLQPLDGSSAEGDRDPVTGRDDAAPTAALEELIQRKNLTLDESRPDAIARIHGTGHRTVRENLADLSDPDSFTEYGALAIAAQRRRRSIDDLQTRTPADGLITGTASIHGRRCAVIGYDLSVLAGTQGVTNHKKLDRMLELARRDALPTVIFVHGGGGRPGDTDGRLGFDGQMLQLLARLSGRVPVIGVVQGFCFAGNAALAACCDVLIATADSTIGMGGPEMVAAAGLGAVEAGDIGPTAVQRRNGVIDLVVDDDQSAVDLARRYLAYAVGNRTPWEAPDQASLRQAIPGHRQRIYQVRPILHTIADVGSVIELRQDFGPGIITALGRVEGHAVGIVANDCTYLGGALDSPSMDKAARFMQLCDSYGIAVLTLCDTPGIMVGPQAEETALVRHAGRLLLAGANLRVPLMTVVLRRAYGVAAMAMTGGSFRTPRFVVAWPSAEFGGMSIEGGVRLAYRKELAALTDPTERQAYFEKKVLRMYEDSKALNIASHFEIDDVIDPATTRHWIAQVLDAHGSAREALPPAHRYLDAW